MSLSIFERVRRRYLLWQLRSAKDELWHLLPHETEKRRQLGCRIGTLKHILLRDYGDKAVFFALLVSLFPWEYL